MISIDLSTDDRAVSDALDVLVHRLTDATPAMQAIGEHLVETTKRRFSTGRDPDGHPWKPNRPATIARHLARFSSSYTKTGKLSKAGKTRMAAKKPLTGETKSLGTTIHYRAGRMEVAIGSPMIYAAVQHFGAEKGSLGTTRRGAPIPWGDIPARRFLGFSDDDRAAIVDIVSGWLMDASATNR